MIYHVYYAGLHVSPISDVTLAACKTEVDVKLAGRDQRKLVARLIKETKGNTFVFIVTKDQLDGFKRMMLEEQGLKDYISYEMKQPITNGNYPDHGRKLWLFVFKTKE